MATKRTSSGINSAKALKFVQIDEIVWLNAGLNRVAVLLGDAYRRSQAEFGAYMLYSLFLEEGTRPNRKTNHPGMKARPHIKRAIFKTQRAIRRGLEAGTLQMMRRIVAGRKLDVDNAVERLWTRVLNDKPRIWAVRETARQEIFEFGFHRRSIRGHGKVRSAVDIATEQFIANSAREAKAMSRREVKRTQRSRREAKQLASKFLGFT